MFNSFQLLSLLQDIRLQKARDLNEPLPNQDVVTVENIFGYSLDILPQTGSRTPTNTLQ